MKKIWAIIFILFPYVVLADDLSSLYRPFQRDLIVLLDWESELESLFYLFDSSKANLNRGLGTVAGKLAAAVYYPSVPIIVSAPTWRTILERAQFVQDASSISEQEFVNKYLAKYQNKAGYQNTLLVNNNFLVRLYQFCKKSLETYYQVNQKISQKISSNRINMEVGKLFSDPTLKGFLNNQDDIKLWNGVNELLKAYLIIEKVKVQKNDWIFRRAGDCIYLMVPRSYLNEVKVKSEIYSKNIQSNKSLNSILKNSLKDKQTGRFLSYDEMILGIKFDNFPSNLDPFEIPAMPCDEKYGSGVSDSFIGKSEVWGQGKKRTVFNGILTQIIINAEDFLTFTQKQYVERSGLSWIPQYLVWNIYGNGHGSPPNVEGPKEPGFYVMGLREKAIESFLDFWNSINTRFLYYTSCYAAGHRLRTLYMHEEQGRVEKKKFSYTVAVGAITQVVTTSIWYPMGMPPYPQQVVPNYPIDKASKTLIPEFYTKFGQFFNDLHVLVKPDPLTKKPKVVTFQSILALIDDFTSPAYLSNIPQIRFAGSKWFNVIDLGKNLLRLTSTYIRTKEAEINTAVTAEKRKLLIKDKSLLMVDAEPIWQTLAGSAHSQINFPIEIQGSMPTIISMVMGNAWHRFEKIDAKNFGLLEVLKKFWGVSGTFYARTYFINELQVRNDINNAAQFGAQNISPLLLKNVYIFSNASDPRNLANKHSQGIIFTYNNKIYSFVYSLTSSAEINNANNALRQGNLPNIQNIPGQVPSYEESIQYFFPNEKRKQEEGLEDVAQFILDKQKQMTLVAEYEKIKSQGQLIFESWKKIQTPENIKFIQKYEDLQSMGEKDVRSLLIQLEVDLSALRQQLNR